ARLPLTCPPTTDPLSGFEYAAFAGLAVSLGGTATSGTADNDWRMGDPVLGDSLDLSQGGNDTVQGLGGDDRFDFGTTFNTYDQVDGGAGDDTLSLAGDYSVGVIINPLTLQNVEAIELSWDNND